MYLRTVVFLAIIFSYSIACANSSNCTNDAIARPIFINGWSTIENEYSKSFKAVLEYQYGIQVTGDFEIIGLKRRSLVFYDQGWLYEFRVLDQEVEKLIYVLNMNMQSVLLEDDKKLSRFLKRNKPDLTTDVALLEYLVVLTNSKTLSDAQLHIITSNTEFSGYSSNQDELYVSGPRVIHKNDKQALVQAFVNVNGKLFSVVYGVDFKEQNIEMKDSFLVTSTQKNEGCNAPYNKIGVSYNALEQNKKTQVVLHQR